MFALYRLQAKAWFANLFNKMDFMMVVLFLAVMGSMVAMNFNFNIDDSTSMMSETHKLMMMNMVIIGSITTMMIASSALNTFGVSFFEMKESVLLKRIGATEISKPSAILSFVLWGMTSMAMIIGWMYFIVLIMQIPAIASATGGVLYIGNLWKDVNVVGLLAGIIETMIAFYAIAFLFVSITPTSSSYQIIATFYYFLVAFLGGGFTPNADRAWMDVIGFLSPFGWGSGLIGDSLLGMDIFNLGGYSNGLPNSSDGYYGVDSWEAIGQFVMPVIYGGLAIVGSVKLFKWD